MEEAKYEYDYSTDDEYFDDDPIPEEFMEGNLIQNFGYKTLRTSIRGHSISLTHDKTLTKEFTRINEMIERFRYAFDALDYSGTNRHFGLDVVRMKDALEEIILAKKKLYEKYSKYVN
jgi:hypothetical protein